MWKLKLLLKHAVVLLRWKKGRKRQTRGWTSGNPSGNKVLKLKLYYNTAVEGIKLYFQGKYAENGLSDSSVLIRFAWVDFSVPSHANGWMVTSAGMDFIYQRKNMSIIYYGFEWCLIYFSSFFSKGSIHLFSRQIIGICDFLLSQAKEIIKYSSLMVK